MLILNRDKTERVMVGDDITITIVAVGPDEVSIGIELPDELQIHREEIYKGIKKEV